MSRFFRLKRAYKAVAVTLLCLFCSSAFAQSSLSFSLRIANDSALPPNQRVNSVNIYAALPGSAPVRVATFPISFSNASGGVFTGTFQYTASPTATQVTFYSTSINSYGESGPSNSRTLTFNNVQPTPIPSVTPSAPFDLDRDGVSDLVASRKGRVEAVLSASGEHMTLQTGGTILGEMNGGLVMSSPDRKQISLLDPFSLAAGELSAGRPDAQPILCADGNQSHVSFAAVSTTGKKAPALLNGVLTVPDRSLVACGANGFTVALGSALYAQRVTGSGFTVTRFPAKILSLTVIQDRTFVLLEGGRIYEAGDTRRLVARPVSRDQISGISALQGASGAMNLLVATSRGRLYLLPLSNVSKRAVMSSVKSLRGSLATYTRMVQSEE